MKANIPEHEVDLIVNYIYMNYLIEVLETDLSNVPKLNFKLPEVYIGLIENTLKAIRKDLRPIREEMNSLKIKVFPARRVNEEFVEYPYRAHGYEGTQRFWDAAMMMEGKRRLERYLNPRQ